MSLLDRVSQPTSPAGSKIQSDCKQNETQTCRENAGTAWALNCTTDPPRHDGSAAGGTEPSCGTRRDTKRPPTAEACTRAVAKQVELDSAAVVADKGSDRDCAGNARVRIQGRRRSRPRRDDGVAHRAIVVARLDGRKREKDVCDLETRRGRRAMHVPGARGVATAVGQVQVPVYSCIGLYGVSKGRDSRAAKLGDVAVPKGHAAYSDGHSE